MLHEIIKQGLPQVRVITSVNTICSAMSTNNGVLKDMLPSLHKLLRLMNTIPITSATSERTFSAMKRINTYYVQV